MKKESLNTCREQKTASSEIKLVKLVIKITDIASGGYPDILINNCLLHCKDPPTSVTGDSDQVTIDLRLTFTTHA